MKKQLSKKLYACLLVGMAFIIIAMMFSASANAQIVKTNVNPEHAISEGSLPSKINFADRKSHATNFDLNNRPKNKLYEDETGSLREAPDALDKFILKSMKNHHIPGLSASIIKDGKIVWTKGYGYANIEKNIPFTANTANAELASISKTIAATALMKLYEQGAFQLDDPINNYLPFAVINPYFPNVPITFHMLLNHRSSINDYNLAYSPYLAPGTSGSLSDFLQSILVPGGALYADSTSFYNYEPGSEFNYSNYGFALIGYLVEHISGMPFDQYCNQNIFQPLCMDNTGWHFSDIDTNAVSHPYYYDAQSNSWIDYGLYEYGDYADGLLKTSAINLSKFMLMLMNYGIVDGVRILDSTTVAMMTTKEYEIYPNVFTGLCLFHDDYAGYQIWNHTGGDLGIATLLAFNPDNSTGFIILTNGEDNTLSGCTTADDIFCRLLHIADTITTVSSPDLNCSYLEFPCTHSNTFWKNHSDQWALNSVPMKLGTTNFYNEKKVMNILKKPINGNASIVFAKQLIAAKLNVAQGSETTPIYSVINAANDLIGNRNLPVNPGVSFFSSEGLQMLYLAGQLSAYNHGVLNTQPCNANGNRDEGEPDDLYESLSEHEVTISPNPISNTTTISFSLDQSENVSLKIVDVNGRLIEMLTAQVFEEGEHSIEWNAEKVNAGIYFLQVQTEEYSKTEKLIVTK